MSETLTVPVDEVLVGDEISFGGIPFWVEESEESLALTDGWFINGALKDDSFSESFHLPATTEITVTRTDPEKARIEYVAKAIHASDLANDRWYEGWDEMDDGDRDMYLEQGKAAIDAYRSFEE